MYQRLVSISICLMITVISWAQQDTLAKYGPGFRFKDGLYMQASDFKYNCPSYVKADLYTEKGDKRRDLDPKSAFCLMKEDSLINLDFDSIWGLCENGQVYIQHNTAFDRLIVVGKLCHIIHREEVVDYNSNIGMGVASIPVRREIQVEYIIDLDTGESVPFNEGNLLHFMQDDHILYMQYSALSRKERRKAQYVYLHRYNNENPVYFLITGCHGAPEK